MLRKIDPINIQNRSVSDVLLRVLQNYQDRDVFSHHDVFKLDDKSIQLTHTLIRASRHQVDEKKYHIISKIPLGSGGCGTVYSIQLDMLISADRVIRYTKPNPPQIVKHQFIPYPFDTDDAQIIKKKWRHEYDQSKNGHLNAEIPLFQEDAQRGLDIFLPMNRMPGIEFFDFLMAVSEPNSHVSSYARFLLTFELLNTFFKQVVQHKKVHGDLKPSNMMFAMNIQGSYEAFILKGGLRHNAKIPQWQLNIIDFEGCEEFGVPRQFFTSTKQYAASETRAMVKQLGGISHSIYPAMFNEKSDLVSIGMIIGIIWGLVPSDTQKLLTSTLEEHTLIFKTLENMFFYDEPETFRSSLLIPIFAAIACMIDPDPSQRWNLEQSTMFFEDVFARYHQKAVFKPLSVHGLFEKKGDESTQCSSLLSFSEEELSKENVECAQHRCIIT